MLEKPSVSCQGLVTLTGQVRRSTGPESPKQPIPLVAYYFSRVKGK